MLAKVLSAALHGIDAIAVQVEVDIAQGLPQFATVGLPDGAVKESKDRVKAALKNAGYDFPARRITVNLAPADIKKEGAAFLAENKGKPGVKTLTVALSETNKVDLQYKVVTEGTGNKPGSNDTVTVKYRGTLIGGKEFDNSEKRGQPAKFRVNGVIKGWTAALEQMKVGSKWQLFIPSKLAYGETGAEDVIGPNATLIFDIELIDAKNVPATNPAAKQPPKTKAASAKKPASKPTAKPADKPAAK